MHITHIVHYDAEHTMQRGEMQKQVKQQLPPTSWLWYSAGSSLWSALGSISNTDNRECWTSSNETIWSWIANRLFCNLLSFLVNRAWYIENWLFVIWIAFFIERRKELGVHWVGSLTCLHVRSRNSHICQAVGFSCTHKYSSTRTKIETLIQSARHRQTGYTDQHNNTRTNRQAM